MPMFKIVLVVLFLFSSSVQALPWEEHLENIGELENGIFKYQQEMDVLIDKKKNTRERARIEQTLQRIVEIHAELISLRKTMDNTREHLKKNHPEKAHILDNFDSRMFAVKKNKKKNPNSALSKDLDQLLLKVQLKYSSFMSYENTSEKFKKVEQVIESKYKKKKEREADVYLRKRSKIKLSK